MVDIQIYPQARAITFWLIPKVGLPWVKPLV
jgi:hypothetical protein